MPQGSLLFSSISCHDRAGDVGWGRPLAEAAGTAGQVCGAVTSSCLLVPLSSGYSPEAWFVLAAWRLYWPVPADCSHADSLLTIPWIILYCFYSRGSLRFQWRLGTPC